MQCTATGSVTVKASAPDHRCMGATQPGARCETPGSRPHIHSAVVSWTSSRTAAAVLSQAFICSIPEKPNVANGRPAGSCRPAYVPSATATRAPSRTTVTPAGRSAATRCCVGLATGLTSTITVDRRRTARNGCIR